MPDATAYELFLTSRPDPVAKTVTDIEGALPAGLRGALLRNGGGAFRFGPDTLNYFDAPGLAAGLSFGAGGVRLRAAMVGSALWREQSAAGRMTRRGVFTNLPGRFANAFKVVPSNPVNHDIYAYGGRVIASNDPEHVALDPRTLETIGPERWGGAAPRGAMMSPMPRVDPASGRLVVWAQPQRPGRPDRLQFLELDERFDVVRRAEPVALGAGPVLVHGHAFSERWYVCAELPARLSLLPAMLGTKTLFQSFAFPEGSSPTIVLVARDGTSRAVRVATPGRVAIIFHCINAFDDGEHVVLDCVSYETPVPFDALAPADHLRRHGLPERVTGSMPRVVRYVIDPASARVVSTKTIADVPSEALDIDHRRRGRRHRYLYGPVPESAGDEPATSFYGYFHGVARIDADDGTSERWSAGPGRLCSPPAFAARPGSDVEGDGWLLTWVIDSASGNTDVVVHDAQEVARGPIATVHLGVGLPGVSHSNFEPSIELA